MKPVILAYRADWNEAALPTERIDYKSLTHIVHSFAIVSGDGVRFPSLESSHALVTTAHQRGVKVLLAVGGADSNKELSARCATKPGMLSLVGEIAARLKTVGYDGIDIDWEHPENATDTDRLSRFTAALRVALPRPKLVTIAVPSVDWNGRWYDAAELLHHVDWAAVMCYDFFGPWTERAGHHSALFAPKGTDPSLAGSAAVRYWRETKRFPADKLLLGIPLYVRGFRAKRWGDTVPDSADRQFNASYRAMKSAGVTDKVAVCATWPAENGSVIASGDNPESALTKGTWAKQNKLAGVFFWELSQDSDGKSRPSVIQAARKGFEVG